MLSGVSGNERLRVVRPADEGHLTGGIRGTLHTPHDDKDRHEVREGVVLQVHPLVLAEHNGGLALAGRKKKHGGGV